MCMRKFSYLFVAWNVGLLGGGVFPFSTEYREMVVWLRLLYILPTRRFTHARLAVNSPVILYDGNDVTNIIEQNQNAQENRSCSGIFGDCMGYKALGALFISLAGCQIMRKQWRSFSV
ncbi:pD117L [African swine fever virus]|uniref:PD117L n=1 Tax=African swine fever virus TaxID=10497 RepID=A0A8A1V7S8_ASF|nr:pD117L [African swine fever virus]